MPRRILYSWHAKFKEEHRGEGPSYPPKPNACLRTVFHAEETVLDDEIDTAGEGPDSQIVWHEADHAVISEVLCPGSVVLASAHRRSARHGGFVETHFSKNIDPLRLRLYKVVLTLGGRAASEIRFGALDAGSESDLNCAYSITRNLHENLCYGDFSLFANHWPSEKRLEQADAVTAASLEGLYLKAK